MSDADPATLVDAKIAARDPEAWAGFLQQVNRDAGRAESAAGRAEALAEGYTEALEKARAAAENAWHGKVSAEASAKEAKEDAQRAETAADRAEQGLENKGWMFVEGEPDGHLYLYTNNLDSTTLEDENGRLILVYGDD